MLIKIERNVHFNGHLLDLVADTRWVTLQDWRPMCDMAIKKQNYTSKPLLPIFCLLNPAVS